MILDPIAFKSGRTQPNNGRPFVLEGNNLYVSPARFVHMQEEINRPDEPKSSYVRAYRTLLAAGMESGEAASAFQKQWLGLNVIVDREIEEVMR